MSNSQAVTEVRYEWAVRYSDGVLLECTSMKEAEEMLKRYGSGTVVHRRVEISGWQE